VGLILECYAVRSDLVAIGDVRGYGMLVSGVSINSAAVNVMLPLLATGPLATLDLAGPGPTGVRIPQSEIGILPGWLASVDIDPILPTPSKAPWRMPVRSRPICGLDLPEPVVFRSRHGLLSRLARACRADDERPIGFDLAQLAIDACDTQRPLARMRRLLL
jgi:hypothetical protein